MKVLLSCMLSLAMSETAAHAQTSKPTDTATTHTGTPSTSVHVTGAVKAPGDFDLAALKALVARATDGYVVTFSCNELFNTPIGKDVLIAWEKNGKPLGVGEGQFLLISGQDIKTGPRHVRWLSEIEIRREQ